MGAGIRAGAEERISATRQLLDLEQSALDRSAYEGAVTQVIRKPS
jgi:hypothetical protein